MIVFAKHFAALTHQRRIDCTTSTPEEKGASLRIESSPSTVAKGSEGHTHADGHSQRGIRKTCARL